MTENPPLKRTVLFDLHVEQGAKMVPFTGYEMPVQFPDGIIKEHLHTRSAAGLFDVSHMGQIVISGDDPAAALERLVPGDIRSLAPGQMRYTFFTNDAGGILDDLMVTRREKDLYLVVNAACKEQDLALLQDGLKGVAEVTPLFDRALVALQGAKAAEVLSRFAPEVATMRFMTYRDVTIDGVACFVTRSGYTGEDGFEISLPGDAAEAFCRRLMAETEVRPVGLGARDSLRLEAGLCLYGHDLTPETTPVAAGLLWAIAKRRREEGGFPGASVIQAEIAAKPAMKRVGILPEGRAPAREHTEITDMDGNIIGTVTSGGFAPSLEMPVAMGYVPLAFSEVGTKINLLVRGKLRPAVVAKLPFVEHRYYRG